MDRMSPELQTITFLYVEDDADTRDMLCRIFAGRYPDLQLMVAVNGAEGLELFKAHSPDIVITDLNMPVMNGIAMAKEIRAHDSAAIIIAVTAHNEPSYLLNAIEIGIRHYVLKPINAVELFSVIDKTIEEISLRRLVKKIEGERARLAAIVESSNDAIFCVTPEGVITQWNGGAEQIYGYGAQEAIGTKLDLIVPPDRYQEVAELLQKALNGEQIKHFETAGMRRDGKQIIISLTLSAIRDPDGAIVGTSAIARDITERSEMEAIIKHQAQHDILTDLPNRQLFMDFLSLELPQARRNGTRLALLFLDLNGFKQINDKLGHQVGDRLLREVAQRLKACIRKSDTVARLGGDEFIVLMPDLSQMDVVGTVLRKIMGVFEAPFVLEEVTVHPSTSIGISMYPDDGTSGEDLIQRADLAMYDAKASAGSRNSYQFYNADINERTVRRQKTEALLRRAVGNGELELFFQPLVSSNGRNMVQAEALLRWHHPEQGLLAPDQFLAVAEDTGAIVPIGEWVIQQACHQAQIWNRRGYPLSVTVNLSSRQFHHPGLLDRTERILAETSLKPQLLSFEITENTAMEDLDFSCRSIRELARLGVNLTLDNFGSGASSLQWITKMAFRKIKIDRNFIRDMLDEPDHLALINAAVAMSHNLRMRVAANGVETEQQLNAIRESGCDEVQGNLISAPLSVLAFERYMANA